MSYVVLARKYRPSQFFDIVGQSSSTHTLSNAIKNDRIHHAYLFTGSRGIGKTSIARIFSKLIRCENRKIQNQVMVSCDECSNCKEITSSTSVDVLEIDGASNNGVDAVREIRESVKFSPSSGSKKIYIVDEVHMLTTAAFNALLKTLEEPPPHVVFIFATTEPHKIPSTILSRVQRFDFKRVTVAQIQERLVQVCALENVTAEEGALALVSRAADGSMRDALSLLDQVIGFSGNQLTTSSVRESLGLIGTDLVFSLLEAILSRKTAEALRFVNEAYSYGHDLKVLMRSLLEALHGTMLAKLKVTQSGLEFSGEESTKLQQYAGLREIEELEMIFQVIHHGLESVSKSSQPKIVLDILVMKCATAELLVSLESLSTSSVSLAPQNTVTPAAAVKPSVLPSQVIANSIKPQAQASSVSPQPSQAQQAQAPRVAPASASVPVALTAAAPVRSANSVLTLDGFIDHVRKVRPLLASSLEHAVNVVLPNSQATELQLFFKAQDSYKKDQLLARAPFQTLTDQAKAYFGAATEVKIQLTEASGETYAEKKSREDRESEDTAKAQILNHPLIQEAKNLFSAESLTVELIKRGEP